MAAQDVTGFAAAMKVYYGPELRVHKLTYPGNALFAWFPKDTDFVGKSMPIPVTIADIKSGNSSFTRALADKEGTTEVEFTINRKKDYAIASISGELMAAAAVDKGAFLRGSTSQIDSAFNVFAQRTGAGLYGNGSGQLATLSATASVSGATLTLANADDAANLAIGKKLVFAANDTSAPRDSGDWVEILTVNEDAGTFTAKDSSGSTITNFSSAITGLTAGDAVFTYGDYAAASARNRIIGVGGWIPSATPSGIFNGLDRSQHPTALGGQRLAATGMQIDEAIIKLASKIVRQGKPATDCFMSHGNLVRLQNVVRSNALTVNEHNIGKVGFRSLVMTVPGGDINIYADYNAPNDKIYLLRKDTWKLKGLGRVPQILGLENGDGNKILRESADDAYEVRVGAYFETACYAPRYNGVATVTAAT